MSSIRNDPVYDFSFPRPVSPTKESLRPNSHPYAIKTTSTALLSRSNSASKNHDSSHHHYVPQTPPTSSPGPKKHGSGTHRHRYSISLSSDNLPRPLPVPPSPSKEGALHYSTPVLTVEDLPSNPKLWTPGQLCAYLSTALRVKSGETLQLPPQVARDIASFVRESKITGKIFLRLDDKDLEAYGVNKLWKTALLRASQNLRQNILKGQIWGFMDEFEDKSNGIHFPSSVDDFVSEDEDDTPHRRRRSTSQPQFIGDGPTKSTNFPNGLPKYPSASSTSSEEDLFLPAGVSPMISANASRFRESASPNGQSGHSYRGRRHGRVKGMVETFERSSSFDEGDPTSAKLLKEIRDMRELDLEQLRKLRKERSGSTSSVSSGSFGNSHSPTSSSDDGSESGVVASPIEYNFPTVTSSRPLPTPPPRGTDDSFASRNPGEEEPSIEELLAQQDFSGDVIDTLSGLASLSSTLQSKAGSNGSFAKHTFSISKGKGRTKKRGGVYAWEDEADDLGAAATGKATAKRVVSQVPVPVPILMTESFSSAKDIFGDSDSVPGVTREESTGSTWSGDSGIDVSSPVSSVKAETESGSQSHASSRPLPEIPLHPSLVSLPEDLPNQSSAIDTDEEEMILTSIAETTELLEAFKVRLGEVERRVDMLEVEVKELEMVNTAKEKRQAEEREKENAIEKTTQNAAFLQEWPVIRKVIHSLSRFTSSSGQTSSPHKEQRSSASLDPQTLAQLPPYVLLVGLGVCAVVLRVVVKRLGGRK